MVKITLHCPYCQSDRLVKNGHTADGRQRYRCRTCNRQHRENPKPNGYTEGQRETILRAYQERSSLRGLSRTFGVARNTVSRWLQKSPSASPARADVAPRPTRRHPGTR
jgi:transposase-like protein